MPVEHKILTKNGLQVKTLTPIKAIRQKCMECSNWSVIEVRECHITDCALHPYRHGKDPSRQGLGGIENLRKGNGLGGANEKENPPRIGKDRQTDENFKKAAWVGDKKQNDPNRKQF